MNHEETDILVNQLAEGDFLSHLRFLALNLTEKTKMLEVPVGTPIWFYATQPNIYSNYEKRSVSLHRFFGYAVGYAKEIDVLVYWKIP